MMGGRNKRSDNEIEDIVKEFGYSLLNTYTTGSNYRRRVVVEDRWGYLYDVRLENIMNGQGLSPVDTFNPFSLENISLWLRIKNKSFELCDDNVYMNAKEKLKFYCFDCDDVFYMNWNCVQAQNQNCSVCSGQQAGERHSLAYFRPDLAKEWDYDENELSPNEVTCGSSMCVGWICSECGHKWDTRVDSRAGSARNGCPVCAGRIVSNKNRFSILYPDMAKEWHPTKNGDDLPCDFTYGSGYNVWWLCPNGHEYTTEICSRTCGGTGCPKCRKSKGEDVISSWIERNMRNLIEQGALDFGSEVTFKECKDKSSLFFDFGIRFDDDFWFLIEYNGKQHYEPADFAGRGTLWAKKSLEEIVKRDEIKKSFCFDKNYSLLIIPYWEFGNIEKILEENLL